MGDGSLKKEQARPEHAPTSGCRRTCCVRAAFRAETSFQAWGGAMSETITFEKRIVSGADDVEQAASGSMSLTSSDLELVNDGSNNQRVGLRFTGIDIPQGAIITAPISSSRLTRSARRRPRSSSAARTSMTPPLSPAPPTTSPRGDHRCLRRLEPGGVDHGRPSRPRPAHRGPHGHRAGDRRPARLAGGQRHGLRHHRLRHAHRRRLRGQRHHRAAASHRIYPRWDGGLGGEWHTEPAERSQWREDHFRRYALRGGDGRRDPDLQHGQRHSSSWQRLRWYQQWADHDCGRQHKREYLN